MSIPEKGTQIRPPRRQYIRHKIAHPQVGNNPAPCYNRNLERSTIEPHNFINKC